MAILSIQVPDEVEQEYAKRGNSRKAMAEALVRFMHITPSDRFLIFKGEDRKELERVLGCTVQTPEDVLLRVRRALEVHLGGIDVPLTDKQLVRLRAQAKFQSLSFEDYAANRLREAVKYVVEG